MNYKAILLVSAVLGAGTLVLTGQQPTSSAVFTSAQAEAGRIAWGSKTAAQLIARFQETVPYFPPEGMNDETTVNITAYVLQVNGAKAGARPLTRTTQDIVSSVTR
jgi:hypothetical protein